MSNTINILKPSGCFEIQQIIGISTIHGNCRSYQVLWAPSWISGAHLIGCDELIEQFEEEQKEKDAIPFPDIRGSSVINKEMVVVDNITQNNSAAGMRIKREIEIQGDVSRDTDCTFSPNPINQGIVGLKHDSLDSLVQQISERKAGRISVHPDFEGTKMDREIIQDEEVDNEVRFSEEVVIVKNSDKEAEDFPLQNVQKFNKPGKYFGRNRKKRTKQSNANNVNSKLRNLRESSRSSKSHEGDNSLGRRDRTSITFQCNICNKVFSNSVVLKEHCKLHKDVHQCSSCFKSFADEQSFQKHQPNCIGNIQKHKSVVNHKDMECDSNRYSGENNSLEKLKNCTELHNGTYQCIICCKTFGSSKKLQLHNMKIHSTCDICQKKFSDMKKLKLHIETHKTVKTDPLECSYCEKRFSRKMELAMHERVHTGERPYKCGICHKGFKQHSHYKEHLRMHKRKLT